MTSVVDTSVKHGHSGMVGASVLNGVPGSLIGVLDAFLINGYDLKAVTTLVVAAGVATLSFAGAHSATVDSVVLVAGSSIEDLNGEQKVTVIGSGAVKFATAAADGTATGTITFKMAPAGWTKPFSGTNLAVYKSADPAGTGMYLRVDDTGTTFCRVVGYEKMTDINTGTGAFPTALQLSGGGYWPKSSTANATPAAWEAYGDGRKLILHLSPYVASNVTFTSGVTRGFGDDLAFRPGGDPYACSLNLSASGSVSSQGDGGLDLSTAATNTYMPRAYTGLGSSVQTIFGSYVGGNTISGSDGFLGLFPSVVDGGMRLSRKYLSSTTAFADSPRSDLPGLYHVPHTGMINSFRGRDVISGAGPLAGRRLMALQSVVGYTVVPAAGHGISFVDITGPWR